jgi:hypothetical protein
VTELLAAAWDAERIRLRGRAPETEVRVRPAIGAADDLPPMAGSVIREGEDLLFVPRFPFVPGTAYTVYVDAIAAATLTRPREQRPAATQVLEIYPTAPRIPRNLLRCYVQFTGPMSRGYAADHVRLVDDGGKTVKGALLPADHELWDADRTRLTVLLDPARIKRGLISHRQDGYALRSGTSIRLLVDEGFRDAYGEELAAAGLRRYSVGNDELRPIDPSQWTVTIPRRGSREPLTVEFDRPFDHGLLAHSLRVAGSDGLPVLGTTATGSREQSWQLTPDQSWQHTSHLLSVDPALEDVAGNSVARVFDRDLSRPEDRPRPAGPVTVPFRPS